MYQFDSRVRYSEIGADGHMSIDGIVNYFQDCSTFQSEDIGQGMGKLYAKDRAWILSSWQIVVNRYPKLLEKIMVGTWPYGFKGFYGNRNFLMRDEAGKDIAYANSIWVFMDTSTGRPAKLRGEDVAGYDIEEPYPMEYAPRKLALPEGFCKKEPFTIRKSHLDTNRHVNNCQYIRLAGEYADEGRTIRELRVSYRQAAHVGDVIVPMVHAKETGSVVLLADEQEEPYVILEYIYDPD